MKPHLILLPLFLSLIAPAALAESRTVTLTVNGNSLNGPLKSEDILEVPGNHSATLLYCSDSTVITLTLEKDGITFAQKSPQPSYAVAGPCRLRMTVLATARQPQFLTFSLTPETFDASKALVLGPTTNTVVVSYQSSSNLVDWTTVTNQVFPGIPSAQFFRVTATPSTP